VWCGGVWLSPALAGSWGQSKKKTAKSGLNFGR